jgi:hypothetical protein
MKFNGDEVVRLAEAVGIDVPEEDVGPLCEALSSHFEMMGPLMDVQENDLAGWEGFAAVTFDAEW